MLDNPFSMVVAIILIVTVGKVLRARYRNGNEEQGSEYAPFRNDGVRTEGARSEGTAEAENRHLREELKAMKDRLAVLERIATDNNDSGARLDREIDRLRDRS